MFAEHDNNNNNDDDDVQTKSNWQMPSTHNNSIFSVLFLCHPPHTLQAKYIYVDIAVVVRCAHR